MKTLRTLGAATGALALTAALAPAAQAAPDGPDRIIGGTTATSSPGTVALFLNGAYNCTATLLDSNSVLTARHCIGNGAASGLSFRVGSLQYASGGTFHRASKVTSHPGADLAVATLSTPVTNGRTVTLASARPYRNETNSVYGWGRTVCDSGSSSPSLKTANVRVDSLGTDYHGGTAIKSTGINGSAWRGDSGGPQFNSSGQQVGVASTAHCWSSTQTYTSVPDYRSWIVNQAAS